MAAGTFLADIGDVGEQQMSLAVRANGHSHVLECIAITGNALLPAGRVAWKTTRKVPDVGGGPVQGEVQGRLDADEEAGFVWRACTVQAIDEDTVLLVFGEETVTLCRQDGATLDLHDVHGALVRSFLSMSCCGRPPTTQHAHEQLMSSEVGLEEDAVLPPLDPSTQEERIPSNLQAKPSHSTSKPNHPIQPLSQTIPSNLKARASVIRRALCMNTMGRGGSVQPILKLLRARP